MGNIYSYLLCLVPTHILFKVVDAMRPESSEDIETLIKLTHYLDYRVSLLERRLQQLANGPGVKRTTSMHNLMTHETL